MAPGFLSMDLSRCNKRVLTCVRALPGFRVTTLALAQIMTARSCMPFLMVAGEEQAGRVIGPAEVDYHHGVLGVPAVR